MKALHRDDLYAWSRFDEARDLDFHSVVWVRGGSKGVAENVPPENVLIDPLPLTDHDRAHLERLGGAAWIVVTNSDHVRASAEIAAATGAKIAGPAAEQEGFPIACDVWLSDGDEVVPGLRVLALIGSKTPGELALLLEETTLITGDLVRSHRGGELTMLPAAKLSDSRRAKRSVQRLLLLPRLEAVLVGDGYPIFHDARTRLKELVDRLP